MNVWLALAAPEHVHATTARNWWNKEGGRIAFSRFTQLGFLRLMTTSAAMGGRPLSVAEAWKIHDKFYDDDRIGFVAEPREVETRFRKYASARTVSPKIWSDAWLLALAEAAEGTVVTFDRALGARGAHCLLG
jgi:toxin-antitoxin system PIN domain toxin